MTQRTLKRAFSGVIASATAFFASIASAAETVQPYADAMRKSESGMTMWQLIKSGGGTMIFLVLISIAFVATVVYFFLRLRQDKLIAEALSRELLEKLASGKYTAAREVALAQPGIASQITLAALDRSERGTTAMREAAEMTAKTEISQLWENLSWLSDIAVVAPLVGLLGTVLGMIDSFNVIAFSSAAAKPVLLAGGIAKAMINTAAGLAIAIPASIFYSYFRGRIFKITARVEAFTSEVTDVVSDNPVRSRAAHV